MANAPKAEELNRSSGEFNTAPKRARGSVRARGSRAAVAALLMRGGLGVLGRAMPLVASQSFQARKHEWLVRFDQPFFFEKPNDLLNLEAL